MQLRVFLRLPRVVSGNGTTVRCCKPSVTMAFVYGTRVIEAHLTASVYVDSYCTSSSTVADRPRDAACRWRFCYSRWV